MEASQCTRVSVRPFQKSNVRRRVWTRPEEEALIVGLKDLVANGWKCDNGFSPGYLDQLEDSIHKIFPGADLTGAKHINSKLTVWKKVYSQVRDMRKTSGFEFDESRQMVTVPDVVWDSYVKVHPDVRNMRYQAFPFYEDSCENFGKDRATGELAQQVEDAILELEQHRDDGRDVFVPGVVGGKRKKSVNGLNADSSDVCDRMSGKGVEGEDLYDELVDESNGNVGGKSSGKEKKKTGGPSKSTKYKSRKSLEATSADPLISMLGAFFEKQNSTLEAAASRIGRRHDMGAEKARMVFETVNAMTILPRDTRIRVAQKIVKDEQQMNLFINMDFDSQSTFVQMILEDN